MPAPAPRWRSTPGPSGRTRPQDLLRQAVGLGCSFCHRHRRPRAGPARLARPRLPQRRRRRGAPRAHRQPPAGRRPPRLGRPRTRLSGVTLPVRPPVAPMLAKLTRELPREPGLFYEPKWDGFRCIVFRDGDDVEPRQPQREAAHPLLPRAGRGAAARAPGRAACSTARSSSPGPRGLDFDALSQRIHPAEKRIRQLAESTPASFVAFDLLAHDDTSLHGDAVRAAAHDAREGARARHVRRST